MSNEENSNLKEVNSEGGSYNQILLGFGFVLFCLIIGGVGLVTAGVGIGIPMIPLGIYLMIRGYYKVKTNSKLIFEKTSNGKILLGILLFLLGLATGGSIIIVWLFYLVGIYIFSKGIKEKLK